MEAMARILEDHLKQHFRATKDSRFDHIGGMGKWVKKTICPDLLNLGVLPQDPRRGG